MTKSSTPAALLQIDRFFTQSGINPLDEVRYERRSSVIKDPDGTVVFELNDVEIPADWSQLASDILISKYLRKAGVPGTGQETGARQVIERIVKTIRQTGESFGGYFASEAEAQTFEDELAYLLVTQRGAFNSPVWFNCGLYHQYGIQGSSGNYYWNPATDAIEESDNAYAQPQCSACFIQSIDDDLTSIFELIKRESRIFKYGSGTGSNFSALRSKYETLSGGGYSSGLLSFLEVFDRAAGATKSGGTTRRAAKMVILDMDHPEILDFIEWKAREEIKAKALIAEGFDADFNGEAYHTISGQNSNNSIRVTNAFLEKVLTGGDWATRRRIDGQIHETHNAADMFQRVAEAAWSCADPGIQFDTTINEWHTCPNTDRINASNPCSEYMFLDDSACNLASINLLKFLRADGSFDIEGYRHAVRVFILAMDILVDLASYPVESIARNSHDYRPLGLGYANLGALLLSLGIPYDSPRGQAWCSALTSILTGHAYRMSAELARRKGPFVGYTANRQPMLDVIAKHREQAQLIDRDHCPATLYAAAVADWETALGAGEDHGFRNAQATVLAPTGTIGLLMDCDTTGVEPDYALVKFKKLAGGGYFKIVNQSVRRALESLGYAADAVQAMVEYATGTMRLSDAPHINTESLRARGLTDADLQRIEAQLPGSFDLGAAFSARVLGEEALLRCNLDDMANARGFDVLMALGFAPEAIAEAGDVICGHMTMEGAPHLKAEHLPVFDCACRCGSRGRRMIEPMGHVRMMAAAQPFLSGAISKTVNMPEESTVEDIKSVYLAAWRMGLKALALYRDNCKASQPLVSGKRGKVVQKKALTDSESAQEATTAAAPEAFRARAIKLSLPGKRSGFTQVARVAGHKVYLRTGEYENGELGEIFVDMHKEGAAFRSLMNCFAIAVSKGLQYGVPLDEYVDTFTFTRFEPQGMVSGHENIKFATSVVDYIFRVLGMEYLGRFDIVQSPPKADDTSAEAQAEKPRLEPAKRCGPRAGAKADATPEPARTATTHELDPLSQQLSDVMSDSPICDRCGHLTIRNGACYKCVNCGNSIGCS